MAKTPILRINAVGYRSLFAPNGEQIIFKNGICKLTETQADNAAIRDWLEAEHKLLGITLLTDEEITALEDAEKAELEKAAAKEARQSTVNAILQGRDPELIQASTNPQVTTAASALQAKIAEAKAAAGKK